MSAMRFAFSPQFQTHPNNNKQIMSFYQEGILDFEGHRPAFRFTKKVAGAAMANALPELQERLCTEVPTVFFFGVFDGHGHIIRVFGEFLVDLFKENTRHIFGVGL